MLEYKFYVNIFIFPDVNTHNLYVSKFLFPSREKLIKKFLFSFCYGFLNKIKCHAIIWKKNQPIPTK